jgi:hypothetical protein
MKRVLFFMTLLLVYQVAVSQSIRSSQSVNTITGLENGSVSFADYDNDRDMDIIITGATSYNPVTYEPILPEIRLFRNDGNFNFTSIYLTIPAVSCGSVKYILITEAIFSPVQPGRCTLLPIVVLP